MNQFLSTPSARRATTKPRVQAIPLRISIHALREEGDLLREQAAHRRPISIHALREEGDLFDLIYHTKFHNFYPRPPRGGRLFSLHNHLRQRLISIHALREEGDKPSFCFAKYFCNFYPRPPRGGRQGQRAHNEGQKKFLSTPSARRATLQVLNQVIAVQFLSTPSARRATLPCGQGCA